MIRGYTTHQLYPRPPPLLGRGPPSLPAPTARDGAVQVTLPRTLLPRTPGLLEGRGPAQRAGKRRGQDTQSPAQTEASPNPRPCPQAASPPFLHRVHTGRVRVWNAPPPSGPGVRGGVGWGGGHLQAVRRGPRAEGSCTGLYGAGGGSAAVVDAEALHDLPAAQRAGAQRLAALLAAADVAAIEEDHLGLRREGERLGPAPPVPGGWATSPRPTPPSFTGSI